MQAPDGRTIPETSPAQTLVKITSGQAFAPCRGLLVGTAGTGDVTDIGGTVRTAVPLQQGYNPIACTRVTLGTAADVWALY